MACDADAECEAELVVSKVLCVAGLKFRTARLSNIRVAGLSANFGLRRNEISMDR